MARITGTAQLRLVARQLRDAPKELKEDLRIGLRQPVKGFERAVKDEALGSLPHSGGYAGVMSAALKVNLSQALSGSGAGFTLVVFAKGKSEDRDVRATNAGLLRHKTWGREPWHAQRVKGGYVDRPADKLGNEVAQKAQEAVDRVADKLAAGG